MMVFLVYSTETDQTIASRLGLADYSYFFAMKKFLPVLERLGRVLAVEDAATIDTIYDTQRARGREVILLSFTPPQRTPQGLRCPVFPVFAWEYSTIPNESWGNEPRHNWAAVLKSYPGAITHSSFAVAAVRAACDMPEAPYPLASLPAPLWDEYAALYHEDMRTGCNEAWSIDLSKGVILDSHTLDLSPGAPTLTPAFEEHPCNIRLEGVVYTAVFNPNDGRKNWLDLLSAFCFAFRDQPEVTLLLKLAYHDAQVACGMVWHEMQKLAPYRCRVVAIQGYLDREGYRRMVRHSTYIVNTAHGEGQCLPLMEFMSAGKPAIAPDHTAMADYITAENAFVVRSSEEWTHWPHDPRLLLRAMRYRIDWESLRDAYRESYHIATQAPETYHRMAQQAYLTQRNQCSIEIITQRLKHFLNAQGYRPRDRSGLEISLMHRLARLRQRASAMRTPWRFRLRPALPVPLETPASPALQITASPPVCPPPPPAPSVPPDPSLTDARMSGWFHHETAELLQGFAIASEDTVLDVGCGDGPFIHFCGQHGAEVIFADVNADKVAAVEKLLAGTKARAIRPIVSDANPLPLADATATRVICMEVLEHVDDPVQFMAELVRVGKPGAQYLLTVPDPVAETVQKTLAPDSYFQKPNHIRIFERDEFEQLVQGAGLVVERRIAYGFYWSMWWMMFWACEQDLAPPWHPLLQHWAKTWDTLLALPQGPRIKKALDEAMPKSQAIIARKPL